MALDLLCVKGPLGAGDHREVFGQRDRHLGEGGCRGLFCEWIWLQGFVRGRSRIGYGGWVPVTASCGGKGGSFYNAGGNRRLGKNMMVDDCRGLYSGRNRALEFCVWMIAHRLRPCGVSVAPACGAKGGTFYDARATFRVRLIVFEAPHLRSLCVPPINGFGNN